MNIDLLTSSAAPNRTNPSQPDSSALARAILARWEREALLAESEAERQIGVSGRRAITDFGIANFHDACRTSVMCHTGEWGRYVARQARWIDFDNDYRTMDASYMESVLWPASSWYWGMSARGTVGLRSVRRIASRGCASHQGLLLA